jgi:hypothetical protein
MKKLAISLSVVALSLGASINDASAQRYRSDRATITVPVPGVVYRGGRDTRVAADLDRLNREVRQVRLEIRAAGGGGRRIRAQFDRVVRATDQLSYGFRRGVYGPREVRSRAQQIRAELYQVQREIRFRGDRRDRRDRRDWR